MLEIEHTRYGFRTREIWFSEAPFDVSGVDGVSFHACTRNVDLPGFSRREFTTPVIDLTQPLDDIWRRMNRLTRRSLTRAERQGITVRVNEGYQDFFDLNRRFRARKGLPDPDIGVDMMKRYGTVLIAERDGVIIAGKYLLNDDLHMRGLLGASLRLESAKDEQALIADANRLLHWKGIQYAKDAGIEEFDLGGYYTGHRSDPQMEGINAFKRGFGGEIVVQYIYEKDYSPLYAIARSGYRILRSRGVE